MVWSTAVTLILKIWLSRPTELQYHHQAWGWQLNKEAESGKSTPCTLMYCFLLPSSGKESFEKLTKRACAQTDCWVEQCRIPYSLAVSTASPSAILTMLGAVGRCCSGALQAFKPGVASLKTISGRHAALSSCKLTHVLIMNRRVSILCPFAVFFFHP